MRIPDTYIWLLWASAFLVPWLALTTNAIDTSDLVAEALAELRALGIEEAAQ
jgi:hypothetical protein